MNILHISDFHYCEDNTIYEKVITAIIDTINKEFIQIDCILFTGDLVYYGDKTEDYGNAKKALFDRLVKELGIDPSNVIICQGNHDIDRKIIYPTAYNSFNTIYNTNEAINKLYRDRDQSFIDSLQPSNNYSSFEKQFYNSQTDDFFSDLYTIHFRSFNDVLYGFACINSAWLSALDGKGKNDRGNLLFPPMVLEEVVEKLKRRNCRKVLLIHHPLHFLKEYNATEIEKIVFNSFDLMFSGHIHKAHSGSVHDGNNGLYIHVAKASLSYDETIQGCSIISLKDYESNEVVVKEVTYIPDSHECHISQPIIHSIPAGEDKIKAIKFRKTIADKCEIELANAHKLLLLNYDGLSSEFLSLFSFPQLRTRSDDEIGGQDTSDYLTEDDIFINRNNLLILGRDKCGKTSLLKWIQISFLKSFSRYQVIPYYINCKEKENIISDESFNIDEEIRQYYAINTKKEKELVSSGSFVLLLDNYSENSVTAHYFKNYLNENTNCRFIICSEYSAAKPISTYNISEQPFKGYYFQDLNRLEIVKYVEKRITKPEEREEVNEQIIRLCKQMQLPINYWTVSLLLLIHNRSSDTYSRNIYEILDVCVDEIFGKKERALKGADIPFDKLKKICAFVAMRLFIDYKSSTFSASKEGIIDIRNEFIQDDDRLDVQSVDVFNFFYQSGILKVKDLGNDVFVFRHNGFFEYFLALQMTQDEDFKNYILNDSNLYLAFKNEWDIYSGIKRSEGLFLKTIFNKTKEKVDIILDIPNSNVDKTLIEKGKAFSIIENQYKKILAEKPLTPEQKAIIEDSVEELALEAEVRPIDDYISMGLTPDTVERYLFILGRVYRNSDDIPRQFNELKKQVLESIINYYANYAFFSIDYAARLAESAIKDSEYDFSESQEKIILKMITDFSPLLSQVSLTDSIGHKSMGTILKKRLDEIRDDISNNQYIAFLLVFVLTDIDLEKNLDLVKEIMTSITIPVLKTMLYFKLNYYMAFKAGKKQTIQNKLIGMIKEQRHILDNRIKEKDQQKPLHETVKRSDSQARKGKI